MPLMKSQSVPGGTEARAAPNSMVASMIACGFIHETTKAAKALFQSEAFASGMTLGVAISVGGMFAPVLGWAADLWGGLAPAMHLLTPLAAVCVLFACMLKEPEAN